VMWITLYQRILKFEQNLYPFSRKKWRLLL